MVVVVPEACGFVGREERRVRDRRAIRTLWSIEERFLARNDGRSGPDFDGRGMRIKLALDHGLL